MTKVHPAYSARERTRWTRPNAHHFVRPDQARVPAGGPGGGQWTEEGGGEPSSDTSGRIRSAGLVIPVCIIGAKSLYGDGTYKVVYVCADGREITRYGVGRILGIIRQPPK